MRSVSHLPLFLLFAIGLCFLMSSPAQAIGPTIPSDMFDYTVTSVDPENSGYYYVDVAAMSPTGGATKSYLMIFDAPGDLIWFRKPSTYRFSNSCFIPCDNVERTIYSEGELFVVSSTMMIMDTTFTVVDSVPRYHPTQDNVFYDMHELLLMDDGSKWTLWKEPVPMDMSQYWPDGNPNATVVDQIIQHWDENGNILFDWHSLDHLDELDIAARIDTTGLSDSYLEHLHVNAIDIFDDNDLLVSTRDLSIIFRVDYDTGEVLWRMGGGSLNDFTFTNGVNPDIPDDFNVQHHCRIHPDNHITLFDNGWYHDEPMTYIREYVVDENNLTADLIVAVPSDSGFASMITGSQTIMPDGNRVVGWGGMGNEIIASEFDTDFNTIWELDVEPLDGYLDPFAYRCKKWDTFGTAAIPYVVEVFDGETMEVVCNWWGHEDEVGSYNIFFGEIDDPQYVGNTDTGVYTIDNVDPEGQYYLRIKACDHEGFEISDYSNLRYLNFLVGVSEELTGDAPIPLSMTLAPAWPNPFNGQTRISLLLPSPGNVNVAVYDLLGRLVTTLHDGSLTAGQHQFNLNATGLASGMYFVRAINDNGVTSSRRVTLVK
ncbi:aryl-sulfate sulfotransferase [bacterium]|nr:aryl-sulfate sulfotransferase [bacterium]